MIGRAERFTTEDLIPDTVPQTYILASDLIDALDLFFEPRRVQRHEIDQWLQQNDAHPSLLEDLAEEDLIYDFSESGEKSSHLWHAKDWRDHPGGKSDAFSPEVLRIMDAFGAGLKANNDNWKNQPRDEDGRFTESANKLLKRLSYWEAELASARSAKKPNANRIAIAEKRLADARDEAQDIADNRPTPVRIRELRKVLGDDGSEIAATMVDEDELMFPGQWENAGFSRSSAISEYLYEIEKLEAEEGKVDLESLGLPSPDPLPDVDLESLGLADIPASSEVENPTDTPQQLAILKTELGESSAPTSSKTRFTVSPYQGGYAVFDNGTFHSVPGSGTWGAAKKVANQLNDSIRTTKMKLQPQLAQDGKGKFPSGPEWVVERKWDGLRAIFEIGEDETKIFSRTGQDLRPQFPEFANLHEILPPSILDGEVIALDADGVEQLELLQQRAGDKKARKQKEIPVTVKFFDVLEAGGEDARGKNVMERKEQLRSLVGEDFMVETLPQGATIDDIPKHWEGTISKLRDSKYESGKRRASWLKYKFKESTTLRAVGLTEGKGDRASSFGAVIVADANGVVRGQVGSGFTPEDIKTLMDAQKTGNWPLIEVEYRFLSGKNGLLVNTAYKGIRTDKEQADAFSEDGSAVPSAEKFGAPNDYKDIDDRGHGRWAGGTPKMSPLEQVALHDYVSPEHYQNMQKYWRDPQSLEELGEYKQKNVVERARALDEAIRKFGKSWKGQTFYRVTKLPDDVIARLKEGKEAVSESDAFLSMAMESGPARVIARTTQDKDDMSTWLLRITVNSDAPAVSPTDNQLSTTPEVIFAPGQRLRFKGFRPSSATIEVELT